MKQKNAPPKVSIGMPVYNGEKYIRDALDSLLAQTFTDFELIISDNASTDKTEDICREYVTNDCRVRYLRQSKNMGATANFQYVLNEAIGECFMWAAHDDYWESNWLEVLTNKISTTDMSIRGVVTIVDEKKIELGKLPLRNFKKGDFITSFMDNEKNGRAFYLYGLFPTQKIQSLDLQESFNSKYAPDIVAISLLSNYGNLCITNETTQYYRRHDMNEGKQVSAKYNNIQRYLYLAHPVSFYLSFWKIASLNQKYQLLLAIPLKHIKSQLELWKRAVKYLTLKKRHL